MTLPPLGRRTVITAAGAIGASLLAGAPALAQDATPIAGNQAGLGAWSEQLSTLSPDEINRLLLEKPVEPAGYADNIVAVSTDFSADPDWPFPDRPMHEVSLGFEPIDDDREFEIGTGIFLVFADAATAASNLQSIEPGQSGDTTIWAVPFAGLEGRWVTSNRSSAIYLQAGPVILVGTDEFMTDGAYVHLMSSISNVLRISTTSSPTSSRPPTRSSTWIDPRTVPGRPGTALPPDTRAGHTWGARATHGNVPPGSEA